MIIILISWFALAFLGISSNRDCQAPFAPKKAAALRGICSVEIMIGHIGVATGSMILYPNRKAGILFVGIFFLLSGYGVAYSVDNKKDYLRTFLFTRAIRLLVPAYTVRIVMLMIESFLPNFAGECVGLKSFFTGLNWYVWEQLLFYFVYWLVCKLLPNCVDLCVGIFSVLFIMFAYGCNMENPWYGSSLCFALGLYYYKFEKKNDGQTILDKVDCGKKKYENIWLMLVLLITVASCFMFFLTNHSILGNPVARNVASLSFGIAVIMLLNKFNIGNKVSFLLGELSYEIFLVHPYILSILLESPLKSKTMIGVLAAVLSVLSAGGFHFLNGWLLNLPRKDKLCRKGETGCSEKLK